MKSKGNELQFLHKGKQQIQLNEYKFTISYNIKFKLQVTEIVFPRDCITLFDGVRVGARQLEVWSLIFDSSSLAVTTHQNVMCRLQSHLESNKSNYLSYYPLPTLTYCYSANRCDWISYCHILWKDRFLLILLSIGTN